MIVIYLIHEITESYFPAVFARKKCKALNKHHTLILFRGLLEERICSTNPFICYLGSENSWH